MKSLIHFFSILGPGIMAASAAIGTSHLVQCTRAGGKFGFELLWIVIIINIIKYPFIEYGLRYTNATGNNLLQGYYRLKPYYLVTYLIICLIASIGGLTAITYISAGILKAVIGSSFSLEILSLVIIIISILITSIGHYKFLDRMMKVLMVFLLLSTFTAVILAFKSTLSQNHNSVNIYTETAWSFKNFPFIMALMGWMPAPIEISSWYSLWLEEKRIRSNKNNIKDSKIDFNLGYFLMIATAILFLVLGALVLNTSGEEISPKANIFAGQLINIYTKTMGDWSGSIISISILAAILSTMFTTADGYPRSISKAIIILKTRNKNNISKKNEDRIQLIILIFSLLISYYLIIFHVKNFKMLIDIVTITAFVSAPFFAYMNYKVVNSHFVQENLRPSKYMKILSWTGLLFMLTFACIFFYQQFI